MRFYLLTIIYTLVGFVGFAQNAAKFPVPLFDGDSVIKLSLITDVVALKDDKSEDPSYIEGILMHHKSKREFDAFDIKVKARGNTRRLTNLCDFPPLKLNFRKNHVENTIFEGQDKVKFVSQCRQDEIFREYLLEEYLIYKTYNVLTDLSYRVRLVEITIRDRDFKTEPIEMTGFLIEDDDLFEERTGLKQYKGVVHNQDSCDSETVDLLSMFQYMIGNTDWYVNTKHNIDVYRNKSNGDLLPVAFDFDFAGVINTIYAQPSKEIPIKRVTQRYYKGSCREEETYSPLIEHFNSRKGEIFSLYQSFDLLSDTAIKKSLKYYTRFYRIINNESLSETPFMAKCNAPLN